jgi:hypothetical protein
MAGPKRTADRREHTGDAQADRMQSVPNELVAMLRRCPFVVGRLVTVRFTAFTTKVVFHRLGVPAACIVVRRSEGSGTIYEVPATTHDPKNSLPLQCDTTSTWDLWFYPRSSRPIDNTTGQSK